MNDLVTVSGLVSHRFFCCGLLESARRQVDRTLRPAARVSQAERKLLGPDAFCHQREAGAVGAHPTAPAPTHAEGEEVVHDPGASQAFGGSRI